MKNTNVYDVQVVSGVLATLSAMPLYAETYPRSDSKTAYDLQFWTRPTIEWSLECEQDPSKSRPEVVKQLTQNQNIVDGFEVYNPAMVVGVSAFMFLFWSLFLCFPFHVFDFEWKCCKCKNQKYRIAYAMIPYFFLTLLFMIQAVAEIANMISLNDRKASEWEDYNMVNGCTDKQSSFNSDTI